jgi:RNA polymerase sigma-70 factor (ECF subfamily)
VIDPGVGGGRRDVPRPFPSRAESAIVGAMDLEQADREAALLERIALRDEAAFTELFDRLSPLVLGFLVRLLGRRDEAEEVLQEVFLQVWREAARYLPERATAKGWIFLIARSRALDSIRSREARRKREEGTGADLVGASFGADPAALDGQIDVHDALEELSPEQRACVALSFFAGCSQTQIASRLGIPLGTVKSRFLYGMRKLRERLGPVDERLAESAQEEPA